MENRNNEQKGFSYTYSAKDQAELKRIREKYAPPTEEEDKMARLLRLDASVTQTAMIVALALGIVGALTLGLGMSLCLTELGNGLGSHTAALALGIINGVIGSVLVALAYPAYNMIVKKRREKLAPEILRLTDELMK